MNHSTISNHNNSSKNHSIPYRTPDYDLTDTASNYKHVIDEEGYHAFSHGIVTIEEIVKDVLSNADSVYRHDANQGERAHLNKQHSPKYFLTVINLCKIAHHPDYEFSPYVELFFSCCAAIKSEYDNINNWRNLKIQFYLFNQFIALIYDEGNKPEFKKKINRMKETARRNYHRAAEYIDALFNYQDKRLLVLRIDFSYAQEYINQITVDQAKKDLEHFLNNRRGNHTLFNHWAGYIYKLEWGLQKGIHFHLVIFYKGSKRWQDVYLAQEIGEYWRSITDGRGIYWNCNADKHSYPDLGIGMVHIDDAEKRQILLERVIGYLTKSEQYLRAKKMNKERCFVTGIMPNR
jgi:hypothetical protein